MQQYRLKKEHFDNPAGSIVYDCQKCNYGCASEDTRNFGIEHKAMTLDPSGDYPFFTVPVCDLDPITGAESI